MVSECPLRHASEEDVSENSENSDSESSYSEYTESTTSGALVWDDGMPSAWDGNVLLDYAIILVSSFSRRCY